MVTTATIKKSNAGFPKELIDFSLKAEAKGYQTPSFRSTQEISLEPTADAVPWNKRDRQALKVLFQIEEIEDICRDINTLLQVVFPEPCWEDDAMDFLVEYL